MVSSNQAEEAVVSDVSKELADMELTYRIAEQWDKHYNVEVTLENVRDKKIDNWEIDLPANYLNWKKCQETRLYMPKLRKYARKSKISLGIFVEEQE